MSRLGDVSTTLDTRGKENKVFSRIIRTPFGVLLTFVLKKQKSLYCLSFSQTVAHQEGNLASTERIEWRSLSRNSESVIFLDLIL